MFCNLVHIFSVYGNKKLVNIVTFTPIFLVSPFLPNPFVIKKLLMTPYRFTVIQ